MKNILKLLFLSLLVMSYSCDNQDMDLLTVNTVASGEITAPAQGSSYVLNFEENQLNPAFTLTWNPADYGIPTQINYSIEFAKSGTDFADPYLAGKTTNRLCNCKAQVKVSITIPGSVSFNGATF